jgi:hypothetical protein
MNSQEENPDKTLFNEDDIKEINILDVFGNTMEPEIQHYDPEIEVEDSDYVVYEHPDISEI